MLRHHAIGLSLTLSSGCLSPIAMHRAVIEYDRTVSYVEADLLLNLMESDDDVQAGGFLHRFSSTD